MIIRTIYNPWIRTRTLKAIENEKNRFREHWKVTSEQRIE